ncbi:class I SAM-dependent methyltransferase [Cognatilysobacter bugurensis]|uniref:Methyltransferase n=1 Tax=Cognatilysobacter bugurensis TaxID=543356 RepID=A0A918SZK0_9GAMM|nr:class I SAM-dependent methyltransferase [Lysobacter bugurensis]GHA78660.1 methyltransferase [Lysobacter bugurensis]
MNTAAATRPLEAAAANAIARRFLPSSRFGNRWDYHYTRIKLGTDPLYPGVHDALRGCDAPLLDMGCGLGLLAHTLRAAGLATPYRGVDSDASKIARGTRVASQAGLADVGFETVDLARTIPEHRGSVAILDVLQFIPDEAQVRLIDAAIAMLTPDARLVIRTGLADGSTRARVTRAVDVFSRVVGWMHRAPQRFPDAAQLRARFDAAGLSSEFVPLHGNTPFNNWRVVAWR